MFSNLNAPLSGSTLRYRHPTLQGCCSSGFNRGKFADDSYFFLGYCDRALPQKAAPKINRGRTIVK